MLFFVRQADDGLWLVIAVKVVEEGETRHGEVVTLGTGQSKEEAFADCKSDLMGLGYPEHEATAGGVVWRRPDA